MFPFVFFLNLITELLYSVALLVLVGILNILETVGTAMLKPFDFSTLMFSQMFSGDFLNTVENIMITAGISISILLLVLGLVKVFTGRLSDDVPNPFALVGKFIVAVFSCYWIIPIINQYLFPFAQNFFDEMLKISVINFGDKFSEDWAQPIVNMFSDPDTIANGLFKTSLDAATGIGTIKALMLLIIFLIFIISAVVNVIKLVVENAERYFTINVLILGGPLATSTIVSEKSIQIFKNWLLSLISNVLTIVFNLFGFKLVLLGFQNCFKKIVEANQAGTIFETDNFEKILIALVSLVAISKMAQKFDQFISMIVFRINPIQNRSLLMSALGTAGKLDKIGSGIMRGDSPLGKLAHGVKDTASKSLGGSPLFKGMKGVADGIKNGKNGSGVPNGSSKATPVNYDNKVNKDGALKNPLNGNVSDNLKNNLGIDGDNQAALQTDSELDPAGNTRVGAGSIIDAIQDKNKTTSDGDKTITSHQAQQVMNAINSQLKDADGANGNKIIGYDTDKREFIIGKAPEGTKTLGDDAPAVANLMNGASNVERIQLNGSDNDAYEKFQSYKDAGYYYANRGHGNIDVYLDKTDSE